MTLRAHIFTCLVVLACGVGVGAVTAASASAATFVDEHCVISGDPLPGGGSTAWSIDDQCPRGFEFVHGGFSSEGETHEGYYFDNPRAPIVSFTVTLSGSNGAEHGFTQGVRACGLLVCGDLATVSGADTAGEQTVTFSLEAGQIPPGATRLEFFGRCDTAPACAPDDHPLRVSRIAITRSDETPPDFDLSFFDDDGNPVSDSAAPWHRRDITFSAGGGDLESGLLTDRAEWSNVSGTFCAQGVLLPPDPVGDCFETFSLMYMQQGTNSIHYTLIDRAGLSTTKSFDVRVDTIAPHQPIGPKLGPGTGPWLSSRAAVLRWSNGDETVENDHQSGVRQVVYDVDPVTAGQFSPAVAADPDPVSVVQEGVDSVPIVFPAAGEWSITFHTVDGAGNVSRPAYLTAVVDDVAPPAPEFDSIPDLTRADASTGRTLEWRLASASPSGICGYALAINRTAAFNPGEDPARPTFYGDGTSFTLAPLAVQNLSDGHQYVHVRAFSCAGVPGAVTHQPVFVDLTAPSITATPASGWISADEGFSLNAVDGGSTADQSGVREIDFGVDGPPSTAQAGAHASVDLTDGPHEVTFKAVDNAGNESALATASVRVDRSPPVGRIEPFDPANPARVEATAEDAESGLAEAHLEFKSAAGGPWQLLGERFAPANPQTGVHGIAAMLPDNGELPPGAYRLRLVATDGVGQRSVITTIGGGEAGFNLPARAAPKLTAQFAARRGSDVAQLTVAHGATARLRGVLAAPDGVPIAGEQLTIVAERAGAVARRTAEVVTDERGGYEFVVPPGTSRTLTVRFAGNARFRGASAEAQLLVRAGITLSARPRVATGRAGVMLRGRVLADDAQLPTRGKNVAIEIWSGGRKLDVELAATCDGAGYFSKLWRPGGGRALRLRLRAVATAEAGWPFEVGRSKWVKVVFRR